MTSIISYSECMWKELATYYFVSVKMVCRIVLELISIFQCLICIYVYHSCMHKCNPATNFYSVSLILQQLSCSVPISVFWWKEGLSRLRWFSMPPPSAFVSLLPKLLPRNPVSAVTNTNSQQSNLIETTWQKHKFVMCKQTFHKRLETVQSVENFPNLAAIG